MPETTVIYTAEKIRTLDPQQPEVKAIAVNRGEIVGVGTLESLQQKAGGHARVVELGGAVIVPGLEDAHAHLASLGRSLTTMNLNGPTHLAEVLERVKAAPPSSYQGEWLLGRGWDQNDWQPAERAFPDRKALDTLFPKTPLWLVRVDGHAAWVNGEALRRAGITKKTKDPRGGRIVRDQRGEPTGVLVDNAMDLVSVNIPAPSSELRAERLTNALKRCAEVGLTAVHDAGMDFQTFNYLQQLDAFGKLPMRIYAMADGQGAEAQKYLDLGPFTGRMLTMKSVKLLLDGALGSRGAALHAPYSDEPSQSGLLLFTPEEYEAKVRAFMQRGFQVNTHAIGDRANTLVIDIVSKVAKETGHQGWRHRLEHAQILRVEDIERAAKLGFIASMQPTHATSDMPWAEARLGKDRLAGAYAWKSFLKHGARLAFGSDFPIEAPAPLPGIYAARARQDAKGQPEGGWYPEERLTGEEALAAFTTGAAYAAFAENQRGQLKPGMAADFVALSVDPVSADPKKLLEAKVLLTVVAGAEIHRAAPRSARIPLDGSSNTF
ncbi:MAG: amidohydrolase [Myxococcaceae bacterium]